MSNFHGLNDVTDQTNNGLNDVTNQINNSGHISNISPNYPTIVSESNSSAAGGSIMVSKHYFIFFIYIHITCILDGCEPKE
jgi:hypothetical protein